MTTNPVSKLKPARRKFGRWVLIGLIAVLIGGMFFGKTNVMRLLRSSREREAKKEAIRKLHYEVDSLRSQNAKLKSDTSYIERIGREKLGMARKDETVYKFIKDDKK